MILWSFWTHILDQPLIRGRRQTSVLQKSNTETFPLIFSRGAKDAITGELEEDYREKREMAIKPDSSSRSTTYRTMRSKSL